MWYIHSMECYLVLERNEIPVHFTAWMNLNKSCFKKPVAKSIYILYDSFILNAQKSQITETESRSMTTWVGRWKSMLTANELNNIFRMIAMSSNWLVVMVAQLYMFIKNN